MARSRIFTASYVQIVTYLVGVTMGTIALLVFLNASISFVITDIIGQKHDVGDATGTLGLADELVIIFLSPIWGAVSDRVGVRTVCAAGFVVIAFSFLGITQVGSVYPDLLLVRLVFSIGAAASSCMITAILPAVCSEPPKPSDSTSESIETSTHEHVAQNTREEQSSASHEQKASRSNEGSTSRASGMVGFASGIGALFGLLVLLRIPSFFETNNSSPAVALRATYGIAALISVIVAGACLFGLRGLMGGESSNSSQETSDVTLARGKFNAGCHGLLEAARLGIYRRDFALAYLGGFVARASSVGISLFIPLYVNTCFMTSGSCDSDRHYKHDIKSQCRSAFVVASQMTGVSQTAGLIFAGALGAFAGRDKGVIPLALSSSLGLIGYLLLARGSCPSAEANAAEPALLVIMALVGISQIGAVVCSLGLLGKCVLSDRASDSSDDNGSSLTEESRPLLGTHKQKDYRELKGSIAGVYNLTGGLGILLLTKLGGLLFDKLSSATPFIMLASFNAVLLFACVLHMAASNGWLMKARSILHP